MKATKRPASPSPSVPAAKRSKGLQPAAPVQHAEAPGAEAQSAAGSEEKPQGDWVEVHAGGKKYLTTKQTLMAQGGVLARLAQPDAFGFSARTSGEPIQIDRNGKLFGHVLEYLRQNRLPAGLAANTLRDLTQEARYFDLPELETETKHIYADRQSKRDNKGSKQYPEKYLTFVEKLMLHDSGNEVPEKKLNKLLAIISHEHKELLQSKLEHAVSTEHSSLLYVLLARITSGAESIQYAAKIPYFLPLPAPIAEMCALVLLREKDFTKAEQVARKLLELQPKNVNLLMTLATSLHGLKEFLQAEEYARKALNIDPNDAGIHARLALILGDQSRFKDAQAAAQKAVKLQPKDSTAHLILANVYLARGRYQQAEDHFQSALATRLLDERALSSLALCMIMQGKPMLAESFCRTTLAETKPSSAMYLRLGQALSAQGKLSLAQAAHIEALRLPNADWTNLLELASGLERQGRLAEAEQMLRRATSAHEHQAIGHYELASFLLRAQRWEEAEVAARRAVALQDNLFFAHEVLGFSLRSQGKETAAQDAFSRSADPTRRSLTTSIALANSLQRQGSLQLVADTIQSAVALDL